VQATSSTGAVRHGAECFNFCFPQELDDQYLIVWEGFACTAGVPWEYRSEPETRNFLKGRISEGFCFPLNPIWPVRDPGWWDLFEALRNSRHGLEAMRAWYRLPYSGLCGLMDEIHAAHPDGFHRVASNSLFFPDVEGCEQADLGAFRVSQAHESLLRATKKWQAVRRFSTSVASIQSGGSRRTEDEEKEEEGEEEEEEETDEAEEDRQKKRPNAQALHTRQ